MDFTKKIKISSPLTERFRVFTGYACNIRCEFCFYADKPVKNIEKDVFRQLVLGKKFGMTGVDFSGGEPTILPYWVDLLRFANELGFKDICSITNGYKYSDIEFLKKCIDNGLNDILFSLHGPNSKIHDGLTGVYESFDRIIAAIHNAKELGINFRINTVVSKYNHTIMPELAELINELNPSHINYLPFRIESNSNPVNLVTMTESLKSVKEAIDLINKDIEINVRYVPFCMMSGYEKYVSTYIQRMFDVNEWSEYLFSKMDNVRDFGSILDIDFKTDRLTLELEAFKNTVTDVCKKVSTCTGCSLIWICEGIWKSYLNRFGDDEFNCVKGEAVYDPLFFRK